MISGSENADARPAMTLFQPHPKGLPSISQSKMGLPWPAPWRRASHNCDVQGISAHLSSPGWGLMSTRTFSNCSAVRADLLSAQASEDTKPKRMEKENNIIVLANIMNSAPDFARGRTNLPHSI